MITENEAQHRQCPHVRIIVNETGVIQDGDNPIYEQSNCIASGCMAWRWAPPEVGDQHEFMSWDPVPTNRPPKHGPWQWNEESSRWESLMPAKGYCGLSGRPE